MGSNPPTPTAIEIAETALRSMAQHPGTPLARLRAGTVKRWAEEMIGSVSPPMNADEIKRWIKIANADPEIVGSNARGPRWKWPARAAADPERVREFVRAERRAAAELRSLVRSAAAPLTPAPPVAATVSAVATLLDAVTLGWPTTRRGRA